MASTTAFTLPYALASTRAFVSRSFAQISPPARGLLLIGLGLALAALGYSQFQDRKLRREVERLHEALQESLREREGFAARIAQERERAETGFKEGTIKALICIRGDEAIVTSILCHDIVIERCDTDIGIGPRTEARVGVLIDRGA